jgi:hypothetical protein
MKYQLGLKMKKILLFVICVFSAGAFAQQSYNFNNSPQNFNNSPQNFNNSPQNFNSTNGVYDNQGNRQGYQVQSPTGVVNYFDNNGNRTGYAPK